MGLLMITVTRLLMGRPKYNQAQFGSLLARKQILLPNFSEEKENLSPAIRRKKKEKEGKKAEEEKGCNRSYQWQRTSRSLLPTI